MKRKPRQLPPKTAPVKRAPTVDLESLEIPNHLVAKEPHENALWPTLMLRRIGGDRDEYLFVSKVYGDAVWPSSCEHPPTWMDPEMLLRMARRCPEVLELIEKCQKLNSKAPAKELAEWLETVFLDTYVPYIEKLFLEGGAAAALADWLIANRAWQLSDPKLESRRARKN